MGFRTLHLLVLLALISAVASAQQPGQRQVIPSLEKDGCVNLGNVKACKYDYTANGKKVEAISFQPDGEGPFPGILMVPGYQRRAADYIYLGRIFGQQGFASLAVTQPGFGKSQGKADYVGPATINALTTGFKRFQRESYVDANRLGVFGYSRGGMAASLLAVKLKEIKAAAFGAGIYDFKKAYDEIKMEGIRQNMKAESRMTGQAIRERSSILRMKELRAPVLILHGEKDENVPVSQALALRDILIELKKDFEITLFPNAEHSIPRNELVSKLIDFFNRKLKGVKANEQTPELQNRLR
jgi:dipeptidyl aminopeptidase/acylaminoacyl peptidase